MLSNPRIFTKSVTVLLVLIVLLAIGLSTACDTFNKKPASLTETRTFSGKGKEFGEPFGVAIDKTGSVFVSDGERGKLVKINKSGAVEKEFAGFDTPSAIAFEAGGGLIVADSGSHTIKRLNPETGEVSLIAGVLGKRGSLDGEGATALFNAPIGVCVAADGRIFIADTYNDRIRVLENGVVSTLAGSTRGYSDGIGASAQFDTPAGLVVLSDGSLLVADSGNRRLRRVDTNGVVTTVAGTGEDDLVDGFPLAAKFVEPTSLAVSPQGAVYVADGNAIRVIGKRPLAFVETISNDRRGFADGPLRKSSFNRPGGLAFDQNGDLFIADSENQVLRIMTGAGRGKRITEEEKTALRPTAEEFRASHPGRWTYDPPTAKRDIAGTLGEVRGEVVGEKQVWFHNGLDLAGGYGEKAYTIRPAKVLKPIAAENFGDLRELLRFPEIGYVHLRLGRDKDNKLFGDERFQFSFGSDGVPTDVRVARGTKFDAGELLGTLNAFNHVHLIAGRTGAEFNALRALELPGVSDSIVPVIEGIALFRRDWSSVGETGKSALRIKKSDEIRLTVRAFDRMDGNPERRKLGVYRVGYQFLREDRTAVTEQKWTISFEKMPEFDLARLVYAPGSKSGYTPETIFDYIASNEVSGDSGREGFLDLKGFSPGPLILRVFVADLFGNIAAKDQLIEIVE